MFILTHVKWMYTMSFRLLRMNLFFDTFRYILSESTNYICFSNFLIGTSIGARLKWKIIWYLNLRVTVVKFNVVKVSLITITSHRTTTLALHYSLAMCAEVELWANKYQQIFKNKFILYSLNSHLILITYTVLVSFY